MNKDEYGWIWMNMDEYGWIWVNMDEYGWILKQRTCKLKVISRMDVWQP